jgi:DNA (cytosine-5)-methyltransferase 1
MAQYSLVDLFAGTGAFSYAGLKTKRITPVFANDIEPSSKLIYDANVAVTADTKERHSLTLADIHSLKADEIPDCDILSAGFSCQSYSIAGKRLGFDDERSDVIWKVIEILRVKQPRIAIMENVKGLLSHDKGKSFEVILKSIADVGYMIKYQVLNTCVHTNVPQNRERVYILCFKHRHDFDAFVFPSEMKNLRSVSDFIDRDVNEKYFYTSRYTIYDEVKDSVVKSYDENVIYQYRRSHTRENKSSVCPTLTANMGTGGHNVPLIRYPSQQSETTEAVRIRKLTPRECFRFQGFTDEYVLPPSLCDGKLYALAGNAVSANLVQLIFNQVIQVLDAHR